MSTRKSIHQTSNHTANYLGNNFISIYIHGFVDQANDFIVMACKDYSLGLDLLMDMKNFLS